jgi:exosortase
MQVMTQDKVDDSKSGLLRRLTWAAFSALLIWNYFPTLRWMIERWDEVDSYMAHGWLIPPISLFLLWQEREKIKTTTHSASLLGFFVIVVALLFHLVAGMADVSSISGITILGVLLGFVLLQFGIPMTKVVWFPIVFLFFMVPPPEFIISKLNFSLKLMAADFATGLMNLIGLPAIRQGSYMVFGTEKLAVGDVCSGLRSLLALLSLSVLYAWMIRYKGKRHVVAILLMGIPAAIIGNGLRIFLVSCLVMAFGQKVVFKPLIGTWDIHLFTGAVIFIAAFTCLFMVSYTLEKITPLPADRGKDSHVPQ